MLFCLFRLVTISLRDVAKLVPGLLLISQILQVHLIERNPVKQMTMEFFRFRDFAVPLLGLSTRHPSIDEMRATPLADSCFRTPHLPDAVGVKDCPYPGMQLTQAVTVFQMRSLTLF